MSLGPSFLDGLYTKDNPTLSPSILDGLLVVENTSLSPSHLDGLQTYNLPALSVSRFEDLFVLESKALGISLTDTLTVFELTVVLPETTTGHDKFHSHGNHLPGPNSTLNGTDENGNLAQLPFSKTAEPDKIPRRDVDGHLAVPTTPNSDGDASSKAYVDLKTARLKDDVALAGAAPVLADMATLTTSGDVAYGKGTGGRQFLLAAIHDENSDTLKKYQMEFTEVT
jgi:hypothetical protein